MSKIFSKNGIEKKMSKLYSKKTCQNEIVKYFVRNIIKRILF